MITVKKNDEKTYTVTVEEGGTMSSHKVTLNDSYHKKLTDGKESKESLIERAFEFLLQRESKESILSSFDLTAINRYFPEFEKKITRR